jgi:NADPH-dependent 2,4-dienoyl-CoA reductase/sulfur reductase-like enzyme
VEGLGADDSQKGRPGRARPGFQPEYYDKAYLFVDLAVIGAGPAGLRAALTPPMPGPRCC